MKRAVISIIILLVAFRLALPTAIKWYAEKKINQIPDYHVTIGDISLHLYRGSYSIRDIQLKKVNDKVPVPFFTAKRIDLALEWRPLLSGAFVGKLKFYRPELNFVIEPSGNNQQLSIDKQWQQAVKALFPLHFNAVKVEEGQLNFQSYTSNPPFKLFLQNIRLRMENIQNIHHYAQHFPSTIHATAKSMDGANVNLSGQYDPFSKQPTFYINFSIKGMQVKEANNFLHHYTRIDVKDGLFSLFIEMAAAKGKVTGYAKPIIRDLKVAEPKSNDPLEALYKGALDIASKILTNPRKETIATRINIKGDIENPDTDALVIIGNLLSHAFIQALLPQIDHNLELEDIDLSNKAIQS